MFDIETDAALSVFALSEIILAGISRLAVCETSHEDLGLYPGLGRGGQLWWNSTYIKDHLCLDIPGVVRCFNIHRSSIVDSNGLKQPGFASQNSGRGGGSAPLQWAPSYLRQVIQT